MKALMVCVVLLSCVVSFGQEKFGDWYYIEGRDSFTDVFSQSIFTMNGNKMLTVHRQGDRGGVIYFWGKSLMVGRNNTIAIQHRVDKKAVLSWGLCVGNASGGLADNGGGLDLERIAGDMIGGSSVIVRVTDARDGETVDTRFSLKGFDEALRKLVGKK